MNNYVQPGDVIGVTAPYEVVAGEGAMVGDLFGIAVNDSDSGDTVQLKTTGVFDIEKVSAQAWATVGLLIYWDNSAKKATTTSSGNNLIGTNIATAANPTATGRVRLNGTVS